MSTGGTDRAPEPVVEDFDLKSTWTSQIPIMRASVPMTLNKRLFNYRFWAPRSQP